MLFVHIPKTAGTSFRESIEEVVASRSRRFRKVERDYGASAGVTTSAVKEATYLAKDVSQLVIKSPEDTFMTGHYSIMRYLPHYGIGRVCTFVRDPVSRVVSEYLHACRHHGVTEDFEAFYRQPGMQNRQWKLLAGQPLGCMGAVGVTERYEDSLKVINARFALQLEARTSNANPVSRDKYQDLINIHRESIEVLNKHDIRLYRQATLLLDRRLKALADGAAPLAYHADKLPQAISGYAWWPESSEMVVLEICRVVEGKVSDRVMDGILAKEFSVEAYGLGASRKGYVGFRFGMGSLRAGQYCLRESSSLQVLLDFKR